MNLFKKEKICLVLFLILIIVCTIGGRQYATSTQEEDQEAKLGVSYSSYVQDAGWEDEFSKKDEEISGTTGKSLRLEAIKIKLQNNSDLNVGIKYETHIQDVGWQGWIHNGEMSGTVDENKRLEAIKIELENTEDYSVMYRTHVEEYGWQEWKKDGEISGTTGESKRVEAIQIKIVDKILGVEYSTHIQDVGWESDFSKKDGQTSGTQERSLRLEAIKIRMYNAPNIKIKYQTHVEDYGWQNWKMEGEVSGTTGESKRLEGIKIKLEGTEKYSVMYRAYVQDLGWQQWCYDGEAAGTVEESKRLEAIEIKIVPKINQFQTFICIDTPRDNISSTTQKISGWVMTTVADTNLKILVDNDEIDISSLKRVERKDVLNVMKGYGDETVLNSLPGYEIETDFSKYNKDNHTVTVQVIKDNTVIAERRSDFQIRTIEMSTGYYGTTGLKTLNDGRGTDLKYYRYGSGPNVLFATFAIHGFEDLWDYDGWELVRIAEDFHNTLINSNDYDLAEKWTIYILPGVNQDGLVYGNTKNGPGRTTVYSQAPQNKGIDLNRCWQIGDAYTRFTDSRNYNGTTGFQAYEAQYLRDFLLNHKSWDGQNVLIDLHGWTQQLIGDQEICSYYDKQFGENDKSAIGRYGTGYLINWARYYLDSSRGLAKTALIELPNRGINGTASVLNQRFSSRYISATLDMLKNMPVNNGANRARKAKSTNKQPVDTSLKFQVAFSGMINNETPKYEEVEKIIEENLPKNKGIWIEENSRGQVLNLFNNNKNIKSLYDIDENGYLKIAEKNTQTEYDKKLEKVINGDKQYILNISSKCYIIDDATGEILDYNFEEMDKYQIYEYFEKEGDKIIFINQNTHNQLVDAEIFESIIRIFD